MVLDVLADTISICPGICGIMVKFKMVIRLFVSAIIALQISAAADGFANTNRSKSLVSYVNSRKDLSKKERRIWVKKIRRKFGSAAKLKANKELGVAKEIISSAIFMRKSHRPAIKAAWEGWKGVLAGVPPPIAVYYQILNLENRPPRGRMVDFAFRFPDYYTDEFAPELVRFWEKSLEDGIVPDAVLEKTITALRATQIKMRPLLLDKLRTLSWLARQKAVYRGLDKKQLDEDMSKLESDLSRSFRGVAQRPEVLKKKKRPFDRLRIQLELMNIPLSAEDRFLDPDGPTPPMRAVPFSLPPKQASPDTSSGEVLTEPSGLPPSPPPPPQPRPGDLNQYGPPLSKAELTELLKRYRVRLTETLTPWIGTPYRWGGNLRQVGVDSSGLIQAVYQAAFLLALPRACSDQYRVGKTVPKGLWRPGDLIFFDTRDRGRVDHVGLYIGKGEMMHVSSSRGVVRDKVNRRNYRRAYRGARRILASSRQ